MATLFWVGGTGTHDNATNHYATTSGGVATVSTPTSADTVTFDTASNATSYTVTISATLTCLDLTIGNPASGTVTWGGTSGVSVFGNFSTAVDIGNSGGFTFSATSGTKTITSNGKFFLPTVTLNGIGGTFQLVDNISFANGFTRTNGTFSANSKKVIFIGSGSTHSLSGDFTGTSSLFDLELGGSSDGILNLSQNIAITGTLSTNNSGRYVLRSNTIGTARTVTSAANSLSRIDFRDIAAAGAANWNLSAITGLSGDCGGNSGITFTTGATQFWQTLTTGSKNWDTAGNWFLGTNGTGGAGRVPLPQDDARFDANSIGAASTTIVAVPDGAFGSAALCKSVDFTGVTNTPTFTTSSSASIFGSITLDPNMTLTASSQTYTFEGRASYTLFSAGKTWAKSFTITAPGGTVTLLDNLITTTQLNLTTGTWDADAFDITCSGVFGMGSGTIINMGSGTWSITGTGTAWSGQLASTVNGETATVKFTDTSNNAVTFQGGNQTFYNLWFDRGASTGSITIASSANTFNNIRDTGTAAHSLLITAASTQSVASWSVRGSAGNLITLNSTTTGTFTLIKTSTGNIYSDYLDIQHAIVTSPKGGGWYAGENSINNQGVATAGSGWIFSDSAGTVNKTFNKTTRPRAFAPGLAR